jgi:hypothetical protein
MMEIEEKFPFEFHVESSKSYNDHHDYQMTETIQITLCQQHLRYSQQETDAI